MLRQAKKFTKKLLAQSIKSLNAVSDPSVRAFLQVGALPRRDPHRTPHDARETHGGAPT